MSDPYNLNKKDTTSYVGTAIDSNNKAGAFVRAKARHSNYLNG